MVKGLLRAEIKADVLCEIDLLKGSSPCRSLLLCYQIEQEINPVYLTWFLGLSMSKRGLAPR